MSSPYRELSRWQKNALRENDIKLFDQLQACARLCDKFVKYTNQFFEAQEAAIAAGADRYEVRFGIKGLEEAQPSTADALPARPDMAGPDAQAGSIPSAPEAGSEHNADAAPAPKDKRNYVPRLNAPPIFVLGVRAIELLERISPLLHEQFEHLVHSGIDVRRLTYDGDDAAIAALLLDELGLQYHEIGATDYDRMREALAKMEAWVKANFGKKKEAAEGADTGPPVPPAAGPEEGPGETAEPAPEAKAPPVEHAAPPEEKSRSEREPVLYSAGKESLDWTRL